MTLPILDVNALDRHSGKIETSVNDLQFPCTLVKKQVGPRIVVDYFENYSFRQAATNKPDNDWDKARNYSPLHNDDAEYTPPQPTQHKKPQTHTPQTTMDIVRLTSELAQQLINLTMIGIRHVTTLLCITMTR
ncbi:hypothetical protein J6590_030025 [Homalodisca vitripennis]|nr:hypothetical protein J6590_030025 [Homalodisca vitripennis]